MTTAGTTNTDGEGQNRPSNKMAAGSGTNENDGLLDNEPLDPARAQRLRLATIVICSLSVISTFVQGAVTLAVGVIDNSAASFAFSFTALLDSMTSIVVIWRYCGNDEEIFAIEKERMALFVLGILFVISFCTTFTKSVVSLAYRMLPRQDPLTWNIAIANTIVSAALAGAKFYLSAQLSSRSIFTDGVNSSIATILAAAIIASSVVYDTHKGVWFLDAAVGILCALFLLIYGVRLLYNGHGSIYRLLTKKLSGKPDGQYQEMKDKN